jgi:hypothetical protein
MTSVFRTLAEARTVEGAGYRLREMFGRSTDIQIGPEVYLVERPPGDTLGAHFHDVDQFQVFFDSPGATYQRRPITSVMVHYTDAYTTYGPFRAGPVAPLQYFTVRATRSSIHGPMPQSRELLPYRGRRNHIVDLGPFLRTDRRPPTEHEEHTLLEPAADGLAARVVHLAPAAAYAPPAHRQTAGRCYCVIGGELDVAGRRLGPRALGWSTPERDGPQLMSAAGCTVLLLDFPFPPTPSADRR